MELKFISEERIKEYKNFVIKKVEQCPYVTPSAIALRSGYCGFTEFKFTDLRSIAEQVKQIYLTTNKDVK